MSEKRQCARRVYRDRFGGRSCDVNATLEEDGKWWCRHHAPSKEKERREATEARWQEKSKCEAHLWAGRAIGAAVLAKWEAKEPGVKWPEWLSKIARTHAPKHD